MYTLKKFYAEPLLRDEKKFRSFYNAVPFARQQKVDRIKDPESKAVSLAVGMLIHEMAESFHIREADIVTGEFGKPMLVGGKPPFFNVSHKDLWAVLAVSKKGEIGVDIESIGLYRPKLAERYYTKNEVDWLRDIRDENVRRYEFYKIWTMKEAYGKMTGGGLVDGLGFDTTERFPLLRFTTQDMEDGYIVTVCERV